MPIEVLEPTKSEHKQLSLMEMRPGATVVASPALQQAVLVLICAERLPSSASSSHRASSPCSLLRARRPAESMRKLVSLLHRIKFSRRVDERFAATMACEAAPHRRHCHGGARFNIWSNSAVRPSRLPLGAGVVDRQ